MRKLLRTVLVAGAMIGATGAPALAADTGVAIKGPTGADMGTVLLSEGPSGVLLRLELKGLEPGWHAVHFHEKADCSDPKFTAAGAHINHASAKKPHGLLNPAGPDMGDLPNVYAGADGMAHAQIFSALVSMKGAGERPGLQDADGSAIVVHANPDDYTTQPIGGAGDRVACGVIK